MTRPRIGLTQRADTVPGRAERRDALDQRWAARLGSAGYLSIPVPNRLDDPDAFVDELDLALLILTGGNDIDALDGARHSAPERDETERRLLAAAAGRGLPVLGVCRGLQSMVHHSGGRLRPITGHVAVPHPIELIAESRWPVRDGRVVNSFHDWAVDPDDIGPDFVPFALAPDGTVEAAYHRALPQVCVMWHPERDPEDADDLDLIRALVGAV
jgi:N5-(cytidine 5'-diphosphoramidyl)-L-glutamine hydrolase